MSADQLAAIAENQRLANADAMRKVAIELRDHITRPLRDTYKALAKLDHARPLSATASRLPIPGTAAFTALHQRHPGFTCWASCEPNAISREHDTRAFLILPRGENPQNYRWPVAGRDVVLIGTGATDRQIISVCRAMLRNGAFKITIVHGETWRVSHLTIVSAKAVQNAA